MKLWNVLFLLSFNSFCFSKVNTKVHLDPLNISSFPKILVNASLSIQGELSAKKILRDFDLYEDLHKISEYQVELVKEPRKIALVVDTSGSVKSFLDDIKLGVKSFINQMDDRDQAMLVSFANRVKLQHKLTLDKLSLKNKVDLLISRGGTKLYDGIYGGLSKLKGKNQLLVLFTDGKDQYHPDDTRPYSKKSLNEVISFSREKMVPIYIIGVGENTDENVLSNISQSSGGKYFKTYNPKDLSSIFTNISTLLEGRIKISYQSPNKKYDGKLRRVTLKEKQTKVQHQRVYAIGDLQNDRAVLKYRTDWINNNQRLNLNSFDFTQKIESSFSVDHMLIVSGGVPSLSEGSLHIVGPKSSLDLSDPFNPKVMVDPGKVDFKAPVLNISPLKINSNVKLKNSFTSDWTNDNEDNDDDNENIGIDLGNLW